MSTIVKDNNKKYLAIAFKHLLTALLIAIIGSWCFQLLYPAIAGIFTNTAKNEINIIYSHLIFVVSIILWCCYKFPIVRQFKKQPLSTLTYYPIIAVLALICFIILGSVIDIPNYYQQELESVMQENFPCILTIGVVQPIAEEILFRGVFLKELLKWKSNPWWAIGVSAITFSIIHVNFTQMISALPLGIIMGWLYFKTQSLWPSIIIHITNNSICCIPSSIGSLSFLDIICNHPLIGILIIVPLNSILIFLIIRRINYKTERL